MSQTPPTATTSLPSTTILPSTTTSLPSTTTTAVQPAVGPSFQVHAIRPARRARQQAVAQPPAAAPAPAPAPAPAQLSTMDPVDSYELEWERADSLLPIPGYSGPQPRTTFQDPGCTELSIFNKIFDNEVWQMMVDYTNLYADVFRTAEPDKHKDKWTALSVGELQCYFGMVIAMGIAKCPRIDYYWQQRYPTTSMLGIQTVMPRNRFQAISRYL